MIQEIKMIKEIKNPACSKYGGEEQRDSVEKKIFGKLFHYLIQSFWSLWEMFE